MLTVTSCHSECCVPSGLNFEDAGSYVVLFFVFALGTLSHCKYDMGALSWSNVETVVRVPTPLFGRLVRCRPWALFREIMVSPYIRHPCLSNVTAQFFIQVTSYQHIININMKLRAFNKSYPRNSKVSVDYTIYKCYTYG